MNDILLGVGTKVKRVATNEDGELSAMVGGVVISRNDAEGVLLVETKRNSELLLVSYTEAALGIAKVAYRGILTIEEAVNMLKVTVIGTVNYVEIEAGLYNMFDAIGGK